MRTIFTIAALTLSLSTFASSNSIQTVEDLAIRTAEAQEALMENEGISTKSLKACKTVTSCTTDFKGNSSCTAKLVCDL
jgi:hypothetical protein